MRLRSDHCWCWRMRCGWRVLRGAFDQPLDLGLGWFVVGVLGFETRGDHRHAEVVFEGIVHGIAPNHIGLLSGCVLNKIGDFGDFVHQNFLRTEGDVQQDEIGTCDVLVIEQWRFQRFVDGLEGAPIP